MKKIIYLFATAITLLSCGNSTPDDSDIKEAGRAAILQHVKDVRSSYFHHNETISDLGNNMWQYTETVNATNGFGGSVANNVVVKLMWTGEDPGEVTSYRIIDLQAQER